MIPAPLYALLAPLVAPETLEDAMSNGGRPAKPYAALRVRRALTTARGKVGPDAAGMMRHTAGVTYELEIIFHGLDGLARAQAAEARFEFDETLRRACALGLGFGRSNGATEVPIFVDRMQHEEAGMLDFNVYGVIETIEDVGLIEHAVITGRFENSDAPQIRVIKSSPSAVMPPPVEETEG